MTRFHTSGTNWSSLYDGRHISPSYPTPLGQHDQLFPFLGRVIVYVEEFSACFFFARRFAFFDAALEAPGTGSLPGTAPGTDEALAALAAANVCFILPPISSWSLARLKEAFGALVMP